MTPELRNQLVRLSLEEGLSLEFRMACRRELGDFATQTAATHEQSQQAVSAVPVGIGYREGD